MQGRESSQRKRSSKDHTTLVASYFRCDSTGQTSHDSCPLAAKRTDERFGRLTQVCFQVTRCVIQAPACHAQACVPPTRPHACTHSSRRGCVIEKPGQHKPAGQDEAQLRLQAGHMQGHTVEQAWCENPYQQIHSDPCPSADEAYSSHKPCVQIAGDP